MRHAFVLCGLLLLSLGSARGQADGVVLDDDLTLRAAGLPSDGPGLLAFFKARTATQVDADELKKLIETLGDKDREKRDEAYRKLVGYGPLAVPALRAATNDPDGTTAGVMAQKCLDVIQGEKSTQTIGLALRVLALRRPEGTAAVLLAFAPMADSDEMLDEIRRAVIDSSFDADGKPDPALIKGLTDDQPARRALAAEVLGMRGAEPREAVRKLLADPKGSVRLKSGIALANAREPKAVSTIIASLKELPPNLLRDAEEYLIGIAGDQAPKLQLTGEAPVKEKAVAAWDDWWKKTELPAVLDEVKKRTMTDVQREQALALIKKLGDENFRTRLAAREELMKMGVVVVPLLRRAAADPTDPEMRDKAKVALTEIEKTAPGSLSPVYPRLIAFRKPAGSVEALLAFVPFADEETVMTEVQAALNVLAYEGGKLNPALLTALKDKVAARRAAAAEAICTSFGAKELEDVRALLKDDDASVKVKAALALAAARDKDVVPLLIAMIADLPAEQAAKADEFLTQLAGDDAPPTVAGTEAGIRQKRRDAYLAWWKDKGSKVPMSALLSKPTRELYLGYTLVISPNHSKLVEVGMDGKVRFEINGLSNVWDAQWISRNRLLVLESGARKVTERNTRGDVLWEMTYNNIYPYGMQRLPNGNIMLYSNSRIQEMTRSGKEVFAFNRPNGDIYHARKLKDGQIVFVTSSSTAHRIDEKGAEVKTWRLTNPTNYGCWILPNGNVIYPQQYNNRIYETDQNSAQVFTAAAVQPISVARAPNGNTIIGSGNPFQIAEVDRNGKEVWKVNVPIQPIRIIRR